MDRLPYMSKTGWLNLSLQHKHVPSKEILKPLTVKGGRSAVLNYSNPFIFVRNTVSILFTYGSYHTDGARQMQQLSENKTQFE